MSKPRLVVARPVPPALAERARTEFDAVLPAGGDIAADETVQALERHRADASIFGGDPEMDAGPISRSPQGVRVATPHVGGATVETRDVMAARARDIIASIAAGRLPIDPLWG